ncbi:crosslink repair DNA glycosylase YcaQ family protein [Alphaproteobacteria bacterium]|nr:crosslink repair DNA glycosylase YcaQ family protein [Alphaproteobacteria bacterium]
MTTLLTNSDARRLFLFLHGLSGSLNNVEDKAALPGVIKQIGFVQIDSIKIVERAHHHILFSRSNFYDHTWLDYHLEEKRTLFENWTHDASIIPIEFFPYWGHRFSRAHDKLVGSRWWNKRMGDNPGKLCQRVLDYVEKNGATKSRDLRHGNKDSSSKRLEEKTSWWGWNPSKATLVFLWRTGRLAVAKREGFQKSYDLTERVVPDIYRNIEHSEEEYINWNCMTAIENIGFGSHAEIANYWEGISSQEAKNWCNKSLNNYIMTTQVETVDGEAILSWAHPDIFAWVDKLPDPPNIVRFLSPFDPLIRDRKRVRRLFGFDFKIEIYIPELKRVYGYYVYPILEKDKFIGRIEMKVDRRSSSLIVHGFWLEIGFKLTKQRQTKIESELHRWRTFLNLDHIKSLVAELKL